MKTRGFPLKASNVPKKVIVKRRTTVLKKVTPSRNVVSSVVTRNRKNSTPAASSSSKRASRRSKTDESSDDEFTPASATASVVEPKLTRKSAALKKETSVAEKKRYAAPVLLGFTRAKRRPARKTRANPETDSNDSDAESKESDDSSTKSDAGDTAAERGQEDDEKAAEEKKQIEEKASAPVGVAKKALLNIRRIGGPASRQLPSLVPRLAQRRPFTSPIYGKSSAKFDELASKVKSVPAKMTSIPRLTVPAAPGAKSPLIQSPSLLSRTYTPTHAKQVSSPPALKFSKEEIRNLTVEALFNLESGKPMADEKTQHENLGIVSDWFVYGQEAGMPIQNPLALRSQFEHFANVNKQLVDLLKRVDNSFTTNKNSHAGYNGLWTKQMIQQLTEAYRKHNEGIIKIFKKVNVNLETNYGGQVKEHLKEHGTELVKDVLKGNDLTPHVGQPLSAHRQGKTGPIRSATGPLLRTDKQSGRPIALFSQRKLFTGNVVKRAAASEAKKNLAAI